MAAKSGFVTAAEGCVQLERCTTRFLRLRQDAYGTAALKPKHHWLLDIPPQLQRDGMMLDAFVIERQHLLVKGVADHLKNTSDFEGSMCGSLLTLQLQPRDDDAFFDGLIGRTQVLECFANARVADRLCCGCVTIKVGEVVSRGAEASFAVACALEGATMFVIVAVASKVADVTATAVKLRRTEQLTVWKAAEARQSLAWRLEAAGTILLLRL